MQIIAHRGVHGENTRENTTLAFSKALILAFPMIELDASLTKDEKLVVHHDEEIFLSGQRIKFRNYSLECLVANNICTDHGIGIEKHKIPSLELVLEIFLPQISINVELKEKGSAKVLIQLLEDMMRRYREFQSGDLLKKLLISSFEENEVIIFKKAYPKIETALLTSNFQFPISSYHRKMIDRLKRFGIEGLHMPRQRVRKDLIDYLKFKQEMKVRVYTVNDQASLFNCLNLGVDAIFTDKPEMLTCLKSKPISKPVSA